MAVEEVTLRVVVNEIKERVLPTLSDEFAKEVGRRRHPGGAYEEAARGPEEEIAEGEARRALHEVVVARLVEANPFELPPGVIGAETEMHIADLQRQLRGATGRRHPIPGYQR